MRWHAADGFRCRSRQGRGSPRCADHSVGVGAASGLRRHDARRLAALGIRPHRASSQAVWRLRGGHGDDVQHEDAKTRGQRRNPCSSRDAGVAGVRVAGVTTRVARRESFRSSPRASEPPCPRAERQASRVGTYAPTECGIRASQRHEQRDQIEDQAGGQRCPRCARRRREQGADTADAWGGQVEHRPIPKCE